LELCVAVRRRRSLTLPVRMRRHPIDPVIADALTSGEAIHASLSSDRSAERNIDMDIQTDARFLRNIEGYLIELICSVESIGEVNALAEVLVLVQHTLRELEQEPRFAA
jgi:hypothetical protein